MIKQFILKCLVNAFIWLCEILQKSLIDLNKLVADLQLLRNKTIKTIDILDYVYKDDKNITNAKEVKNGKK